MKLYRHYKNKHWYRVVGHARHTETNELLVLYVRTDQNGINQDDGVPWARPAEMFHGQVEHNGKTVDRFELHRFYDDYMDARNA